VCVCEGCRCRKTCPFDDEVIFVSLKHKFHTHLHCQLRSETGNSSCSESVTMATSMRLHTHTHVNVFTDVWCLRLRSFRIIPWELGNVPRLDFSRLGASIIESHRKNKLELIIRSEAFISKSHTHTHTHDAVSR